MSLFSLFKFPKPKLSHEQMKFWDDNGYLILEKFIPDNIINQFIDDVDELFTNRKYKGGKITIDPLEGELAGKRLFLKDVPDDVYEKSNKINDLYLELESCRKLNMNKHLVSFLNQLLGGNSLVINSLTFQKGSQQDNHFDTYYMPPPKPNKMVVTSICLEDHSKEVGPVRYFPGSHKIAPYIFSTGGLTADLSEIDKATDYIEEKMRALNIKEEQFIGKKGDVLIWHGQLYHGGMPIINKEKSRKSLVTHYWRSKDVPYQNEIVHRKNGADYWNREHQKVN